MKWVEAELSGGIYEVGKDDPEYFKYRGIKGYLSPVNITSFGLSTLDMVVANPKYLMEPFKYIPLRSIFELEIYASDPNNICIFTFNQELIKLLGLDFLKASKIYFYFKPSDIIHIISNIKQKISRFLIRIMKN